MKKHVRSFVTVLEEIQPQPLHAHLNSVWWDMAKQEWSTAVLADALPAEDAQNGTRLLHHIQDGYTALLKHVQQIDPTPTEGATAIVAALLAKPQSVQRQEKWYDEMRDLLSASEFYKLFGSPSLYTELLLSKLPSLEHRDTRDCCLSAEMTPMDWGIRFEPLSKQYLERTWGATLAECGRLRHETIPRLAASPDGIVTTCPSQPERVGRLVEIKNPISRAIGKCIPPNYWHQMQLQLEVANLDVCYYCEFTFHSVTAKLSADELKVPETCLAKGVLVILRRETPLEMKYLYGPFGETEWNPPLLEAGWSVVERIPWYLEKVWIQPVVRDRVWFISSIPQITRFWEDVETARRGDYTFPPSPAKRAKREVPCAITE